jgi:hypothetical protein
MSMAYNTNNQIVALPTKYSKRNKEVDYGENRTMRRKMLTYLTTNKMAI